MIGPDAKRFWLIPDRMGRRGYGGKIISYLDKNMAPAGVIR